MKFTVKKLIDDDINLKLITQVGLDNEIIDRYPSRPILEIYTQNDELFTPERIQVLGSREMIIFNRLNDKQKSKALDILFSTVPCIIITKGQTIPNSMKERSIKCNIPILQSDLASAVVVGNITAISSTHIKDTTDLHGILMNIYGIGVLVLGKSGIGKSETCLSLLKRGHQLVSDDRVICNEIYPGYIIGESPALTQNYIELRGIGLVDISKTFGAAAISGPKKIELVTELKPYQASDFERLGFETRYQNIMNSKIPLFDIPVKSGRNLSEIIETAVLVFKQKINGEDPAAEFIKRLKEVTSS